MLKELMMMDYRIHTSLAAQWHKDGLYHIRMKQTTAAIICQEQSAYWYAKARENRDIYIALTNGLEVKIIY